MTVLDFLTETTKKGASDLFIVAGRPLSYKLGGKLLEISGERVMPDETDALVRGIYELAGRDISRLRQTGDDDFSRAFPATG